MAKRTSRAEPAAETGGAAGIHVDRDADVPLGVQLAWALRSQIGDGRMRPGQRLPGLRELADAVGVNLNTVRSVYGRLEQDGLIRTLQGRGTFVSSDAPLRSSAGEIAADAARAARERGVHPREVAAALYVSQSPSEQLPGAEADLRERLRGEIASLDRVLSGLEASHPGLIAPARGRSRGPSLLGAAELEEVRSQLVQRLARIQRAIDGDDEPETPAARSPKRAAAKQARSRRQPGTRPAAAGA